MSEVLFRMSEEEEAAEDGDAPKVSKFNITIPLVSTTIILVSNIILLVSTTGDAPKVLPLSYPCSKGATPRSNP